MIPSRLGIIYFTRGNVGILTRPSREYRGLRITVRLESRLAHLRLKCRKPPALSAGGLGLVGLHFQGSRPNAKPPPGLVRNSVFADSGAASGSACRQRASALGEALPLPSEATLKAWGSFAAPLGQKTLMIFFNLKITFATRPSRKV